MEHTNNKWDSLSMHERAKYIKLALDNGVSDLSMVRDSFNLYANGGNIHIKPENKGKFTELKERTGKSSTWYKENGTPAQKKMATFALNAAKWSHKHDGTSDTQELNIPIYTSSSSNTPTVTPFDITSSHQQFPEEWKDVGRISYDVARLLPITDRITDFIDILGYSPSYDSPLSDGKYDFLNLTDLANALGYNFINPIGNILQKIGDDDVTLKNIFVEPNKYMKIIGKIDKVGDIAQLINDVYQMSKKYKTQKNKEGTLSETDVTPNESFVNYDIKAQGGYLNNLTSRPFSYKPIPVVRYKEGGFLQRVANVLNGWFSDNESTQSDGIDMEELAARQAYAESRYKSNAQSGAGARGLFQIMPSVLSDYNLKNNANYTVDDLYNDTINSQIRNWYFEDLMNRGWNTKNNPSDSVRVAKALAAYNYGSGNVVSQLNKAKEAGIDIYNGWGWLANMPKETRDYVNFVLRNQNSSLHRNNAAYSVSKEINTDKVDLIKNHQYAEGGGVSAQDLVNETPMFLQGATQRAVRWLVDNLGVVDKLRGLNSMATDVLNTVRNIVEHNPSHQEEQKEQLVMMNEEDLKNIIKQDLILHNESTDTNMRLNARMRELDNIQKANQERDELIALQELMGKMEVLNRDDNTYLHDIIKESELKAAKINWSKMSREQIRAKQRELAEAGYYDSTKIPQNLNDTQIRQLQEKLVKLGYLDNSNGKAIDGKIGKNTRKGYKDYMIDKEANGLLGKRTRQAEQKYYASINSGINIQKNVDAHDTKHCAQWVNKAVNTGAYGGAEKYGVVGNAWHMLKNIEKAGGTIIYNAYDNMGGKPKSVAEVVNKSWQAVSDPNKKFTDYLSLKVGDVVGLFMPDSKYIQEALDTGTTYNTHVGVVTGFSADGMPIIEDNINKRKRSHRADDSLMRITVVARPAYQSMLNEIKPVTTKSKYAVSGDNDGYQYDNEDVRTYADSMASIAKEISSIYNNADIDDVQKIALGILGKETQFGKSSSKNSKFTKFKTEVSRYIQSEENASSDFSRFKLGTLNAQQRDYLGIHSIDDLDNPEKAGRAAIFVLARNYDYFARLAEKYPNMGLTKEDIHNLTILSYNQGMGKLYTIGFDENGNYAPWELETIRRLAKEGTDDGNEGYIKGVNRIIANRISEKKQ